MEENEEVQENGHNRHSQGLPSSDFLLFLFLLLLLLIIIIIITSNLPFTFQIFKLHPIKKGWTSLTLALVLFAIICGFLSRNTFGDGNNINSFEKEYETMNSFSRNTSRRTYSSLINAYSSPITANIDLWVDRDLSESLQMNEMRRSYPNLTGYSDHERRSWEYNNNHRFYDDIHLFNGYNYFSLDEREVVRAPRFTAKESGGGDQDESGGSDDVQNSAEIKKNAVKEHAALAVVQMEVIESPPPPLHILPSHSSTPHPPRGPHPSAPSLPSLLSSPPYRLPCTGEIEEIMESESAILPPPQRPLSPSSEPRYTAEIKEIRKREKKKCSAIKDCLNSIKRKEKKQRQMSIDSFFEYESLYALPTVSPSSSPPCFQCLFSKKRRSKTIDVKTVEETGSPDIDRKADDFIYWFKDGLRREKLNENDN